MWSPWQLTLRSAWIVGIVLLAFSCMQLLGVAPHESASLTMVPVAVLIVGILTTVVAIAFRCGMFLSGLEKARPGKAAVTSTIYLVLLVLFSAVPAETRSVRISLPIPGQGHHALLLVPAATLLFVFFALPVLVSYGVYRFTRSRSGVV